MASPPPPPRPPFPPLDEDGHDNDRLYVDPGEPAWDSPRQRSRRLGIAGRLAAGTAVLFGVAFLSAAIALAIAGPGTPASSVETANPTPTATATPSPTPSPTPAFVLERGMVRFLASYAAQADINVDTSGLSATYDGATNTVTVAIMPESKPGSLAGYLTIGSQTSVLAIEALWAEYPALERLDVRVLRAGGDDRLEGGVVTFASYTRATGTALALAEVGEEAARDNKWLFCEADSYDLSVAIWKSLKERGCLRGYTNAGEAGPGPVTQQLPGVGESIELDTDGWTLTALRVAQASAVTGEFRTRTALGTYVIVELLAANADKRTERLCITDIGLVDADGRTYAPDADAIATRGGDDCVEVPSGSDATLTVVFDVADSSSGLVIESRDGFRALLPPLASIPVE